MDVERGNAWARRFPLGRRAWLAVGAAATAAVVAGSSAVILDVTGTAASAAVGRSVTAPSNSRTAPGSSDTAPGNSDTAPNTASGERPEWVPGPSRNPLPLQARAPFIAAVNAEVTGLEAVDGIAQGRGEVASKALRAEITLSNDTTMPISLDTVVVQLYCGEDQTPGVQLSGPRVEPFGGEMAPGEAVVGAYAFTCPEDKRDSVQVTVNYSPNDQTVAFQGRAPRG